MESTLIESYAEVGDHWKLFLSSKENEIPLPSSWNLFFGEGEEVFLTNPQGKQFKAIYQSSPSALLFLEKSPEGQWEGWQLTSKNPFVFSLLEATSSLETPIAPWEDFRLATEATQFLTTVGFENLISLPLLKEVEIFKHQIYTAKTALNRLRGRALLCDEVGLGKTVEAGIILLELYARKLAKKVLILTPPSLVTQWKGEMQRKFSLDFVTPEQFEKDKNPWEAHPLIVASYHLVKKQKGWEKGNWDLVIIDEAHHLRNKNTLLWNFVNRLPFKYILLLTATPIQNSLKDLYHLITLIKPGLLNTAHHFQKEFLDPKDPLNVKNPDKLYELIEETMIRNRRSTVGIQFKRRYAKTIAITPTPQETALYQEFSEYAKQAKGQSLLHLQRLLGSSILSFRENAPEPFASKGSSSCPKITYLLKFLETFSEKIVIFTQFRSTQQFLYQALQEKGHKISLFHGNQSRLQKEEAIRSFRRENQILLSTDAGSEGRNLQFCHTICNFDLPWNPMRLEQRIGRLSRIGQTHDVQVINLVTKGTIEEEILYLLEAKIHLFELVMGEVEMILGKVEEDFEGKIIEFWKTSKTPEEFHLQIETMGDTLIQAKKELLETQTLEDHIFEDRFQAKSR